MPLWYYIDIIIKCKNKFISFNININVHRRFIFYKLFLKINLNFYKVKCIEYNN